MREISLSYGNDSVEFTFDEDLVQVIASASAIQAPLSDAQLGSNLDSPIQSSPIEEIVSVNESVLIVVSDATRATGSAQIVNLIVRRFIQAGISPQKIAIIFATGIHRPVTPEEKLELLTPFIVQRIRTLDHDPSQGPHLIDLGVTNSGSPVAVNRAVKEFDHVFIIGGIGFHYFAGFTG